jgi:hypothetical protein
MRLVSGAAAVAWPLSACAQQPATPAINIAVLTDMSGLFATLAGDLGRSRLHGGGRFRRRGAWQENSGAIVDMPNLSKIRLRLFAMSAFGTKRISNRARVVRYWTTADIGRPWLKTSGSNPAIGGGLMSEIIGGALVLTWAAFVLWFCSNYKILLAWRRVEGRHIAAVAASAAIAAGPTIGH